MLTAAETSTLEENCCVDITSMSSLDLSDEESSNQPTTSETVDSGIQQSVCDHSSQKLTLLNFPNEVKKVFENICNGIVGFISYKLYPANTQMILQYLSHRRRFVTLQNNQHQGRLVRLETRHRLLSSIAIRQELIYPDTQSTAQVVA